MMKLKRSDIFNNHFQHTMRKLTGYPTFPIKLAYSINRISDKVQSEINNSRTVIIGELKKHVVLNEDGTFKLLDAKDPGSYEFKDEAAKDAFNKQEAEFMAGEVEIEWKQLSIVELDGAGFKASATELNSILPIISMGELEVAK